MATRVWLGAAGARAQVNTVTPASVGVGNVFTVTTNGKAVTFTATAATVANVTAGLAAAVVASQEPEFRQLTPFDATTALTLTGPANGAPFTQTSSATGGTATLTTATPTTARSPNDYADAANWSGGAVPVNGDDVIFAGNVPPVLFNLDQHTVTLNSVNFNPDLPRTFAAGLPAWNPAGYAEYRGLYLQTGSGVVTVNSPNVGRINLDYGAAAVGTIVLATGQPTDTDSRALLLKGTHSNNTVNVISGSVGIGLLPGEVPVVADLKLVGTGARGGQLECGPGLTVGAFTQLGGNALFHGGVTTIIQKDGGDLTMLGFGGCATVNLDGGAIYWQSQGNITTLRVAPKAKFDKSRESRPMTVTNCTLNAGCEFLDPLRTITFTNGIVLNRCGVEDVKELDLGKHLTLTVAAGP